MSRLSLFLLGPPRIERDGEQIKVDTRKAIALLAYIAVIGERHRRDSLVNLLWPEYDQIHGRAVLRRTLSALRKALAGDWLDVDRESVSLNMDAGIWVDVRHFRGCLAQCLTHGHPESEVCPACLTPLTEAVELYRDDFLSGFGLRDSFNFDDWQFFQADSLRRELTSAMERIVKCYIAQGEFESATKYARRWLSLDRSNESAHCRLMQLYAWSGQRSDALHQYEECVRILEDQLGVSPQEATIELYKAIKEERAPEPPVDQGFQHREEGREALPELEFPAVSDGKESSTYEPIPIVAGEAKRIVTVLFADISRSFRNTEYNPEDEMLLANRFLGVMKDVLPKYGGRIDRSLGRGILCVFGAAQTHESDPELAIRSAVEIRRELENLELSVTIGINTGEVYSSGMNSEGHREFILVGTVVNLAEHLAGNAQIGQILAGESTHRLTRGVFEFTPLPVDIKGIDNRVTAYEVQSLLPQPKKARGIEGLRAELIGRDEEFAKLKETLAKVLRGQGQMVSIIGEAGVGKSRLVAELRQLAFSRVGDGEVDGRSDKWTPSDLSTSFSRVPSTASSILWLEGRCLELGTAASYWPFIDMLRKHFAWDVRSDDRSRRESIVSSLAQMVGRGYFPEERFDEAWHLLGHLLSVRLGDEWDGRLKNDSPQRIRRQTFLAIHDFFVALSKRQPVILVFEDLHWGDSLSLDLISLLMEALHLGPLLLLCVYRPEQEHKCWHLATIASQKCRERYTELYLRELTHQQSQQMVESLLAIESLPSSARDLILDRSQGNPFFIEEVVHSLIHAGIVYKEGDFWRAQKEIDSTAVPESVQSVILSRLDHLDESLKHILQIASVIGRIFRPRVLEHIVQQQVDLESVLWELQDHALIYQERTVPEEEYSFKHVLAQEVIYQNILREHRQMFHQKVAEAIESLYQANLDEYCEQLAYHHEHGGNVERAVEYLLKAGEKAKRSSANEEAIIHLTRGLELLRDMPDTPQRTRRELDLQIALGVPLVLIKGHGASEVEKTYARARELCDQMGDTSQLFQALVGLRRFHFMRGRLQAAHQLSEQLLSVAQNMQDPRFLSWAYGAMGESLYWLGRFDHARECFEQSISFYDFNQRRSYVFVYGHDMWSADPIYKACILWHLGYPDQALRMSNEGMKRAQELSHPYSFAFASHFTAHFHQLRREPRVVQERAEAVIQISTEQGFSQFLAWGKVMRGWSLAQLGSEKEGVTQILEGMTENRTIGSEMVLTDSFALLAEIYGKSGKIEEGLSALAEALALADRTGARHWEAELYRLKGELLVMQGEIEDEIEACFWRAIQIARRQNARSLELRAATSLSRMWQKQGRQTEARELLQDLYNWFIEGFDTADLRDAKALLNTLA